jgi:hypothetical protein
MKRVMPVCIPRSRRRCKTITKSAVPAGAGEIRAAVFVLDGFRLHASKAIFAQRNEKVKLATVG